MNSKKIIEKVPKNPEDPLVPEGFPYLELVENPKRMPKTFAKHFIY